VAEFTGKLFVPACQLKTCLAVIKLTQTFYGSKRLFHMALRASLTKFILVWILVTIDAAVVLQSCKLLKIFTIPKNPGMTLLAGNLRMFGFKPEFGPVVLKFGCRFKCVESMAILAIDGKGFLVHIRMAGKALIAQTQVGFLLLLQLVAGNEIPFVTILAILRCMFPFQFVPCVIVVKFILYQVHNIIVLPVVITVANDAILAFHLV
jgi:hypothetical protein